MLCSKCYKKIPEGKEIQQTSSLYWRAGWTSGGGGSEVVCKKCAIKERKWNRKMWWIFIIFFAISFLISLATIFYSILKSWK